MRNQKSNRSQAQIHSLERRKLLAATATITPLASATGAASAGLVVTLGPSNRILKTMSIYNGQEGNNGIQLTLGAAIVNLSDEYNQGEFASRFAGFDAAGRAIASIEHTIYAPTGWVQERSAFEFPADGGAARLITGLPALTQQTYDYAAALSANGGVLGAKPVGSTVQITRILNGSTSLLTFTNPSGEQIENVYEATMSDNGDFVLLVQHLQHGLRAIVGRNDVISSWIVSPNFYRWQTDNFADDLSCEMNGSFGAIVAEKKLFRFSLDNPTSTLSWVALPGRDYSYHGAGGTAVDLRPRGDSQFVAVVAETRSSSTLWLWNCDTELGVTGNGVVHIEAGPYYDPQWAGATASGRGMPIFFSSISSRQDGEFGLGVFFRSNNAVTLAPEHTQLLITGHLDDTPSPPPLADLANLVYVRDGSEFQLNPDALEVGTRWGAAYLDSDGETNGIISPGGVTFINDGDANLDYVYIDYYLSTDATLSGNDIMLRRDEFYGLYPFNGSSVTSTKVIGLTGYDSRSQIFLPTTPPPGFSPTGNYYLIAKVDPDNLIPEYDESNNVHAYPFRAIGMAQNRVRGTVRNSAGEGIPGKRVFLDANDNNALDIGELNTISDAAGRYELLLERTGSIHVSVVGTSVTPLEGQTVTFVGSGNVSTSDFYFYTVTGRVTTTAGAPAPGVQVYFDVSQNSRFEAGEPSSISDANGYYSIDIPDVRFGHVLINGSSYTPFNGYWFNVNSFGGRAFDFVVIFPPTNTSRLTGTVFSDANANGRMDIGEPGVAGRKIFADYNYNGRLDAGEASALTDTNGVYQLETRPQQVNLTLSVGDGESVSLPHGATSLWFTSVNGTQTAKPIGLKSDRNITGTIFLDTNRNGRLDAGENKLAGRTVFADYNFNGRLDVGEASALTDATGAYLLPTRATNVSLRLLLKPGESVSLPYGASSIWLSSVSGIITGKNIGVALS